MTDEPHWLNRAVVDAIHDEQLREHGGRAGLRDDGLLESALAAPEQRFAYEEVGLFEPAATYAHRIARNHPFIDGNKRTAFLAAYTFLGLNDYRLDASEEDATAKTLALAAGEIDAGAYADWLRETSVPR